MDAQARRALKLRNMNAVLRLRTFLENYQYLPPDDVLVPLVEHAATERRLEMRQVVAEDVIAPGLREDSLYRRRFNLEHEEWLVVARAQAGSSSTYT